MNRSVNPGIQNASGQQIYKLASRRIYRNFASKEPRLARASRRLLATSSMAALVCLLALGAPAANSQSLPTEGVVISGSASLETPSTSTLLIQQNSQTAIIDWSSFSIGSSSTVTVNQPTNTSALLNRVTGDTPSTIAGQLTANGQVYLINPNGIEITGSGIVKGSAFLASTLAISDADFIQGKLRFSGPANPSRVSNAGSITIFTGGYAALLGGTVDNSGLIVVPLGKIGLGAGQQATLDLSGDGFLQVAIPTGGDQTDALVNNSGMLSANGGLVALSAASAADAVRQAVNMSGTVEAQGISGQDGAIILSAGDGDAYVSGNLDVSAPSGVGGNVTIAGRNISLIGAKIDASGADGGGSIRVGGGIYGSLSSAKTVSVDALSSLKADSRGVGNGGAVSVWSSEHTTFSGTISAQAFGSTGNGGNAEVSGARLDYMGTTNLLSALGKTGTLLLDPGTVIICHTGDAGCSGAQSVSAIQGDASTSDSDYLLDSTLSTALSSANVSLSASLKITDTSAALIQTSTGGSLTLTAPNLSLVGAYGVNGGLILSNTDNVSSVSGVISGAGGLTKNGTGTLSLYGSNTFSSGMTIGAGTLQVLGTGRLGSGSYSGALSTAAGATFTYASSADQTFSNMAAGAGTINLNGTGTASILGTQVFDGILNLNQNTTISGGNDALISGVGNASAINIGNSLVNATATVRLTGGDNSFIGSGSATPITINAGGVLSNTSANTFHIPSILTLAGGTLASLASPTGNAASNGTFNLDNQVNVTANSTISAVDVTLDHTGGTVFNVSPGATLNVSGFFYRSPNNSAASDQGLILSGGGKLTLSGRNTNTAQTTISSGTLQVLNTSTTSTSTGRIGPGAISIASGSTFEITNYDLAGETYFVGNTISGAGQVIFDGPDGAMTSINAVNNYTGGTTISSGIVKIWNNRPFGYGTVMMTGGALRASGSIQTIANAVTLSGTVGFGAGTVVGAVTLAGNTTITASGSYGGAYFNGLNLGSYTLSTSDTGPNTLGAVQFGQGLGINGAITGSGGFSLNASGGDVAVYGTPNFTGDINITSGSFSIGASGNSAVLGGGNYAGSITIGSAGTLRYAGNGAQTLSGGISGTGTLLKDTSTSTLTLGGANTFSGALIVNSGTVKAGATGGFGSSAINLASGATLDLSGYSTASGSLAGAGTVTNTNATASTLTTGSLNTSTNFSGLLQSGAGQLALTKTGLGTLTLSGSNSAFTGALTANAGTIKSGSNYGFGDSALTLAGGATLDLAGYSATIGSLAGTGTVTNSNSTSATLYTGYLNSSTIFNGVVQDGTGSVGLYKLGTGTLTLAGANSYSSSTTVANGTLSLTGSLNVGGGQTTVAVAAGATFEGSGVITAAAFQDSGLGNVNLTGANQIAALSGSGTVGSLSVNNANALALGSISANSVKISTTGVGSDLTISAGATIVTSGAGASLVLAASRNFLNDSGSGAVSVVGGGWWQIYSASPTSDRFGGLNSNNSAIWGQNSASLTSLSGNHYLFSYSPLVSLTSNDFSKTYGDDVTSLLASDYTVSGLQAGVSDAFLGDTFASAFSGAPILTSAGAGPGSGVTASPYGINISAGTLTPTNGYSLAFNSTGLLTVTARPLILTADNQTQIYGNATPTLTYSVGGLGLVNGDTLSGGLATIASSTSNVGNYAITQGSLSAGTNYSISYTAGLDSITARPLIITANDQLQIYGNATPTLTYSVGGLGLVNGDTLSGGLATIASSTSNVGNYAITQGSLSAGTNYSISYTAGLDSITARPLIITANDQLQIYGNATPTLTYSVGGLGLVNGDTLSGGLATIASSTSNVGNYAITQGSLSAGTNYSISYTAGLDSITARPLILTADNQTQIYGNATPTLTYSVGGLGLVNGDTLSGGLATIASSTSNVGNYAITQGSLSAGTNYSISYTAGLDSITARPLILTADNQTQIYGNATPTLTYSVGGLGLVNGDTLSGGLATIASSTSNVGNYAITQGSLSAGTNYSISYTAGLDSITARPLIITANDQLQIYGNATPTLTYSVGGLGLVNGDTLSGGLATIASSTSNVGNYAITQGSLSAGTNYSISYTAGLDSITARPLILTADNQTQIYGNATPTLTYSVGGLGLVNGDTLSGGLATIASSTSNVGNYAITQGSLSAGTNYSISYTAGLDSITARPLILTADNQTQIYGNATPTLTYSVGGLGLVNGDTLSGGLATIASSTSNVGNYAITQGSLSAGTNYSISYTAGLDSITARPLILTADNQTQIYGNATPTLTYSVGGLGLVNGDTLSGGLATIASSTSNVGNYAITQGSLSAGTNYSISYTAGLDSITARPLIITANDQLQIYGNATPTLTYSVGGLGLVNGDTLSGGLATIASSTSNVGNYAITQGSLSAGTNYSISYTAGLDSITARPLIITANDQLQIYGNPTPILTFKVSGLGLVNGDTLSGGLATSASSTSNVGNYTITQGSLKASSNYSVTYIAGTDRIIDDISYLTNVIAKLSASRDRIQTCGYESLPSLETNSQAARCN